MAHHEQESQTVDQLKSWIQQEWTNIQLIKLQQLISSAPKLLKSVIEHWGDVTQW